MTAQPNHSPSLFTSLHTIHPPHSKRQTLPAPSTLVWKGTAGVRHRIQIKVTADMPSFKTCQNTQCGMEEERVQIWWLLDGSVNKEVQKSPLLLKNLHSKTKLHYQKVFAANIFQGMWNQTFYRQKHVSKHYTDSLAESWVYSVIACYCTENRKWVCT